MIGLAEQVDAFLSHLKNERRLSIHTLAAYQRDLTALLKYASEAGIDQAQNLKAADIRGLISQGHRKGLSGRSQQRKLSALRTFFDYLARESGVDLNPAQSISAPKTSRRLPKTLDADQVSNLLMIESDQLARHPRQSDIRTFLFLGATAIGTDSLQQKQSILGRKYRLGSR